MSLWHLTNKPNLIIKMKVNETSWTLYYFKESRCNYYIYFDSISKNNWQYVIKVTGMSWHQQQLENLPMFCFQSAETDSREQGDDLFCDLLLLLQRGQANSGFVGNKVRVHRAQQGRRRTRTGQRSERNHRK